MNFAINRHQRMNRFFIAISAIVLFSCNGTTDRGGSKIDLKIEGAGGQTAYFDRNENNRMLHVDSVKLDDDGSGTIGLPPLPLDFYRITIGDQQMIVVLDSTENLTYHANYQRLDSAIHVEGSKHMQLIHQFTADQRNYEREREQLRQQISSDASNADAITRLNQLNAEHYDRTKSFIEQNTTSPVALSASAQLPFDKEFDLLKKLRDDLRPTMSRSGYFAQFRQRVDQYDQQMLAMKLQEEEMKRLSNLLPIGSEAPEIRQQTPEGGTFALSDLRGKVVLIDFWASWCRPCRIENPAVKQVYNKYRNKGFEILGVSLDRDQNAWTSAIQQDGINWKHVSDLGFWQNAAAQEYGVQSIPFTVLVDKDGKIIEKGLRAHDLDARLAQIFGS
jgi:thiol-disulfide isomerase/thioredoxin